MRVCRCSADLLLGGAARSSFALGVGRLVTGDAAEDFAATLRAAKAGNGWAFTCLYESLNEPVAGFVRARGVGDVDDLVNDVFLAVFNGVGTFSGDEAGFRAWVFRITRNKISDWFRHSSRDRQRLEEAGFELATRSVDDREDERVVGDLTTQELLGTLTSDQREVLLLRVVADLTAQQTAEVLAKPLSAVKALQRRAIRNLRRDIFASVVSK